MRNLCYLLILFALVSCNLPSKKRKGEELAQQHCGSCHQFPEPALLDKSSWQSQVLPAMALRLGLNPKDVSVTELQDQYFQLDEAGLLPEAPLLSEDEWSQILEYYLSLSSDTLKLKAELLSLTNQFTLAIPERSSKPLLPAVTYLHYSQEEETLYYGAYGSQQIYTCKEGSESDVLMHAPSMLSYLYETKANENHVQRLLLTFLGQVIRPDAPAAGVVGEATLKNGDLHHFDLLPLPMLHRPTQAAFAELSGDKQPELVISEFGYLHGRLAYWQKDVQGKYQPFPILEEAGALSFEASDFNSDGLTDLMVLFAHGNERISLFENKGNVSFSEKVLIRFPPVYGSSSFTLADFDGDGLKDIVYTCGDNADLSPVVKPYHGVYLFRNLGDLQYEQVFHQFMPGAYRAIAEDFDQDGDMDVAAVAFFLDEDDPKSPGFLYLEQKEKLHFEPYTMDVKPLGRWISLDAGDVDQDGDMDIILGNGYGLSGLDMIRKVKHEAVGPYIVLENNLYQLKATDYE